jgi:hypothetical protein
VPIPEARHLFHDITLLQDKRGFHEAIGSLSNFSNAGVDLVPGSRAAAHFGSAVADRLGAVAQSCGKCRRER